MTGQMLKRIGKRLGIHVYAILIRPLEAAKPPPPQCIGFRVLSAEELLAACADPALDLAEGSVRAAIARGEVCVGAFDRGTLAGYAWFAY